jgi:hypothetical protein
MAKFLKSEDNFLAIYLHKRSGKTLKVFKVECARKDSQSNIKKT